MRKRQKWIHVFGALLFLLGTIPAAIQAEAAQDSQQVIVTFKEGVTWQEIRQCAGRWAASGVTTVMDLPLISGLSLKVPTTVSLDFLTSDPLVLRAEPDQTIQWKGVANSEDQGSFIQKFLERRPERDHLPWSVLKLFDQSYANPVDEWNAKFLPANIHLAQSMLKERPIKIAVLDTGIFPTHRILKNALSGGVNIVDPIVDLQGKKKPRKVASALDDNGHGTHVAGIVVAPLDADLRMGERAAVKIYAVKILDHHATGDISSIVMGLQWCIDNDMDVANMSVGYRQDSPALKLAVQEAYKAGLIMVASAGNKSNYDDSIVLVGAGDGGAGDGGAGDGGAGDGGAGDGGAGDGFSGILPLYATMYPARYPEVIAVASSTMAGTLASHSNFDSTVDIMAPGTQIVSADITNGKVNDGFGYCNGTSMAAPNVTAAIALMLALNPDLGPRQARDILVQSADYPLYYRVGNINLSKALDAVLYGFVGQDLSNYTSKESSRAYRQVLKAKMSNTGDTLWQQETCGPCQGGTTRLAFKYEGPADEVFVAAYDDPSSKPDKVLFQGNLRLGDIFTVVPRPGQSALNDEISIFVNGILNAKIRTSCSEPIGPGLSYGDFIVVEGKSKTNGPMCPLNACDPAAAPALVYQDRELRWDVTNNGVRDLEIKTIQVSWPQTAGYLDELKRDADKFHDGNFATAPALIASGWETDVGRRTIKRGETRTLKFKFQNSVQAAPGKFSLWIEFTNGCSISIEETK